MPVSKPVQILGGGVTKVPGKARQSLGQGGINRNAAVGMDNFAKLLRTGPETKMEGLNQQADAALAGGGANSPLLRQLAESAQAGPAADQQLYLPRGGALNSLPRVLQGSGQPLQVLASLNSLDACRLSKEDSAVLAVRTAGHRGALREAGKEAQTAVQESVGKISQLFESGKDGIAAIGYDRTGGTSYGQFQIASKTGTMDAFLSFLQDKAPAIAERLQSAGPANTGGRGGKMPEEWKAIAEEQPEAFGKLQQEFIQQQHFTPALQQISAATGLSAGDLSPGLQEVVFSTAVQHGPTGAARIISRAVEQVGVDKLRSNDPKESAEAEQRLVRQIYGGRSTQFGSSSPEVQSAVKNRLEGEMHMVLAMLETSSVG